MFIRLGSTYINAQHITEIRLRERHAGEDNATVNLQDGTSRTGFLAEEEVESLCERLIPAPAGYEVYRPFDVDFSDDFVEKIEWQPVVAFVFQPSLNYLVPITAEDGQLTKFAMRQPNGRIYTSLEEFFDSTEEYLTELRRTFEQDKANRS